MSRSITPAPTPPQTITVSSAAGFNAGDLVYFNGSTGDYGTPTPTTQTGITVTGSKIQPLLGAIIGSYTNAVSGISGACATKNFTATLTNANIVQVFFNATTNEPFFRIVNAAGTVVVAATSISATFLQSGNPNIAVAALTGGGFVVVWINNTGGTANRPCYAVYDNAGVVVAAAGQDLGGTGIGVDNSGMRVVATPSGGFIIAYYSAASTIINARGYAANGTSLFAWVGLSGVTNASGIVGLAVRSNGDFLLTGLATGSATGLYAIWSSVGAGIVGSTTIPVTNGTLTSQCAYDACCLSNGTTFVIAYTFIDSSNATIAFRFLPTGNVLGAEFYVPSVNITGTSLNSYAVFSLTPLTSNRFIVIANAAINQNLCYAVFNSSGVCLSGTSGTTSTAAKPIDVLGSYLAGSTGLQPAVFEAASGLINIYYIYATTKLYSLNQATVSGTTYAVTVITPTAAVKNIGVTAATQAALYQPSVSAPLTAGFSIAPGNYPVSYPFTTIIKAPETVATGTFHCACTTLPDGRILVAYIQSGTSFVKVAVYSVDGVLTQTLSIANNGTTNTANGASLVSIAAMTGGGFVISYTTTAVATFNVYLYNSAFTQVGSVIVATGSGTVTISYSRVAGISGDRYVLAYTNATNQPSYAIYDNTNTLIGGPFTILATAHTGITVAPLANGGFFIASSLTSTTTLWAGTWANTTGNTFATAAAWANTGGSPFMYPNMKAAANSNGVVYIIRPSAVDSYSAIPFTLVGSGGMPSTGSTTFLALTTTDGGAVGFTGLGNPIFTGINTGPVITLFSNVTGATSLSATIFAPRSAFSKVAITPGYGPTFGLVYIDSSSRTQFAILSDDTSQTTAITTAEICTPITIYPGTASGTAIQNTVFTGVALQTVPAGGAGTVQVNGTAQLGSTYPAGTTYRAFDHQSQGVPGVKGTITGRAITLQGT